MASFVAVWDPVADRREAFLRQALPGLEVVPDLRRGRMEVGPVSIAWAAGPDAPISTARRDGDSEGWRRVRRAAEPGRPALEGIFDTDLVGASYLPPPPRTIELEHTIADAAGRKLILGLMLALDEVVDGRR